MRVRVRVRVCVDGDGVGTFVGSIDVCVCMWGMWVHVGRKGKKKTNIKRRVLCVKR